jgi:hypothetical protein
MTLSILCLVMTLSITKLSKIGLVVKLKIKDTEHNDPQQNELYYDLKTFSIKDTQHKRLSL